LKKYRQDVKKKYLNRQKPQREQYQQKVAGKQFIPFLPRFLLHPLQEVMLKLGVKVKNLNYLIEEMLYLGPPTLKELINYQIPQL
jgi:hypothetical protein